MPNAIEILNAAAKKLADFKLIQTENLYQYAKAWLIRNEKFRVADNGSHYTTAEKLTIAKQARVLFDKKFPALHHNIKTLLTSLTANFKNTPEENEFLAALTTLLSNPRAPENYKRFSIAASTIDYKSTQEVKYKETADKILNTLYVSQVYELLFETLPDEEHKRQLKQLLSLNLDIAKDIDKKIFEYGFANQERLLNLVIQNGIIFKDQKSKENPYPFVDFLITQCGLNVNQADSKKLCALQVAVQTGDVDLALHLIKKHGAKTEVLLAPRSFNHTPVEAPSDDEINLDQEIDQHAPTFADFLFKSGEVDFIRNAALEDTKALNTRLWTLLNSSNPTHEEEIANKQLKELYKKINDSIKLWQSSIDIVQPQPLPLIECCCVLAIAHELDLNPDFYYADDFPRTNFHALISGFETIRPELSAALKSLELKIALQSLHNILTRSLTKKDSGVEGERIHQLTDLNTILGSLVHEYGIENIDTEFKKMHGETMLTIAARKNLVHVVPILMGRYGSVDKTNAAHLVAGRFRHFEFIDALKTHEPSIKQTVTALYENLFATIQVNYDETIRETAQLKKSAAAQGNNHYLNNIRRQSNQHFRWTAEERHTRSPNENNVAAVVSALRESPALAINPNLKSLVIMLDLRNAFVAFAFSHDKFTQLVSDKTSNDNAKIAAIHETRKGIYLLLHKVICTAKLSLAEDTLNNDQRTDITTILATAQKLDRAFSAFENEMEVNFPETIPDPVLKLSELEGFVKQYNDSPHTTHKIALPIDQLTTRDLTKLVLFDIDIAKRIFDDASLWKTFNLAELKEIISAYHNRFSKTADRNIHEHCKLVLAKIAAAIKSLSYYELVSLGFFADSHPNYLSILAMAVPGFALNERVRTEIARNNIPVEMAFLEINNLAFNPSQPVKTVQNPRKVFGEYNQKLIQRAEHTHKNPDAEYILQHGIGGAALVTKAINFASNDKAKDYLIQKGSTLLDAAAQEQLRQTLIRIGAQHDNDSTKPSDELLIMAVQRDEAFAHQALATSIDHVRSTAAVDKGVNHLAFAAVTAHPALYRKQLARWTWVPHIFTTIAGFFSANFRVDAACNTLTPEQHAQLLVTHAPLLEKEDPDALAKFAKLDLALQFSVIARCNLKLKSSVFALVKPYNSFVIQKAQTKRSFNNSELTSKTAQGQFNYNMHTLLTTAPVANIKTMREKVPAIFDGYYQSFADHRTGMACPIKTLEYLTTFKNVTDLVERLGPYFFQREQLGNRPELTLDQKLASLFPHQTAEIATIIVNIINTFDKTSLQTLAKKLPDTFRQVINQWTEEDVKKLEIAPKLEAVQTVVSAAVLKLKPQTPAAAQDKNGTNANTAAIAAGLGKSKAVLPSVANPSTKAIIQQPFYKAPLGTNHNSNVGSLNKAPTLSTVGKERIRADLINSTPCALTA